MNRVRRGHGGRERPPYIFRLRAEGCWPRSEVLEQQLLLAGKEAQLQPAEDVVHDRLGEADLGGVGPAAGLEAAVTSCSRRDKRPPPSVPASRPEDKPP